MEYVLTIVTGYLLGSIPAALLTARAHGIDLFQVGDGNPGAWNALEHLGGRRAWPAFIGDGAKALAAGLVGHALGGWWMAFAGVAAAMVGHAAPVFTRFRGGKAVMAFVGGAFALSPVAALIMLAIFIALSFGVSLAWGARVGVFGYPLVQLAVDPVEHVIGTGILMCLIGALFGLARLRRTPGPSTPSGAAPPTA